MSSFDESTLPGKKGKICSMTGCASNQRLCPTLSFFRFPKEVERAKEWIDICERPDLMRRLEADAININNFYVCEMHFENQIMEFATRKILIRTAQPIPIGGTQFDPSSLLSSDLLDNEPTFDHVDLDQDDDDFDRDVDENYLRGLTPQVIITKTEGGYRGNSEDDSEFITDDSASKNILLWSPDATRLLIKLRGEREAEFTQNGAKKTPLWQEISNEMGRHGYDISVERVSKKWHNLMITYMNNKKKNKAVYWEFYDDLEDMFNGQPSIDCDTLADTADAYVTRRTFDNLEQNGVEVQPAGKRKRLEHEESSNSGNDRRKSNRANGRPDYRESDDSNITLSRRAVPNRFRQHVATDGETEAIMAVTSSRAASADDRWWRDYLDRKLDLEREKMQQHDEQHRELMRLRKLEIMTKEKSDKMKIDAIQGLTSAITKFMGTKSEANGLDAVDKAST